MSPSGDSPVSSAMPNRSSAAGRRPFAGAAAPGTCAESGFAPGAGLAAAAGRGKGGAGGPARRAGAATLPAPSAVLRGEGLASAAASSAESSMVLPGPGAGSLVVAPAFLTWKTFLQLVQRTRTPRSVTLSSAMRNFDWQLVHWTTTLAFSLGPRRPDKELSEQKRRPHRSLTHTVGCVRIVSCAPRHGRSLLPAGGVEFTMSENGDKPPPEATGAESADSGDRKEPKVIKRYTNRKLYDTVESRYVTLDEIAQMIKGGAEVKIIDNRSKEDLTSVTLAQIIFEEEKKRSQMPLGVLREIIRHGGEAVASFYQEKTGGLSGKAGGIAGKAAHALTEVKNRTDSLREDIEQRVRGVTSVFRMGDDDKPGPIKELFQAGERAVEDLRSKVDATVKQALDAAVPAMTAEVDRLQKKIEQLEKKIEQLTTRA